ncbi:MAG: class I SAM-dependent methyltransferase [Armatimonadetes bacterium]|nr:class I SAM-dependent methyltransferase [Armatimonadota bacterium]
MLLALLALFGQVQGPIYEPMDDHDPNGIGISYMGREIAQVMGHEGAWWLDRPERFVEEAPQLLLEALELKPGMNVADIGCGTGYLSFPMARKVGPKGKVYAEEIQDEMLTIVKAKSKQYKIDNVVPWLGTTTDPKLPAKTIDLILLVDVYHEFDKPYEMTAGMLKSLKDGGRIVFVEYRKEDPRVPIKEVHKMSEAQMKKEMAIWPLKFVKNDKRLPRQHILIFQKQPEPKG